MFTNKTQREEYLEFMTDVWDGPEIVPCTSYPDAYFPELTKDSLELANQAKAMCYSCPVITKCLNYAIKYEEHGVWGGTTANQRDQFRKQAGIKLPRRNVHEWTVD